MKKELHQSIAGVVLALSVGALHAQAGVKVEDAWVRGTVPRQQATGAFMRLTPEKSLRLVAASSPMAGMVEIHEMALENDVMRMRQVPGVDLAAGRTTELKPGGYHVMLMMLKGQIKGGDAVPITLVFEDDAKRRFTQDIVAPAAALGAMPSKPAAGHKP
ncbi:MAG: copper chaperone PCu(A)C [Rubrivivax sp.]|nr:copper chaperone PCu(A)C [Rubrivivax sp.]